MNGKNAVNAPCSFFISAIDDGDKKRSCWRSLLHNDGYLIIKKFALADVIKTERVIMDSEFQKENRKSFLTWCAERQLSLVIILL